MSGMAYLATGYAVIWAILACYLFWIGRQQVSLRRRIVELEATDQDLDDGGRS
jgi:CcmD family protein